MTFLNDIHLPICFTKKELLAQVLAQTTQTDMQEQGHRAIADPRALDAKIQRAIRGNNLIQLKKGLYIRSCVYFREPDKVRFTEFLASQIYQPSYISLEYVLRKYGMLPANHETSITCITTKTNRSFQNSLGRFQYSNMKPLLFCGFEEVVFHKAASYGSDHAKFHIATKAKALFDYLYLRSDLHRRNTKRLRHQMFQELGIQWEYFFEKDFEEFDRFVWKSNSAKMMRIWHLLKEHFDRKKMNAWVEDFLK